MKKHALAVAVAAALAFATGAVAQQTQGSKAQAMEAVVTVTKIDPAKRTVHVETPKGQTVVAVPDDTKLEDIQVGSRYRVRYSEPVAVAVERGAPSQSSTSEPATAAVGQTGTGTGEGVRKDKTAGIIEQLDPASRQIVVRTFDGGKQAFRVADGAAVQESIKTGDAVTVTYLQAVATQMRSTPQPVSDPAPAP